MYQNGKNITFIDRTNNSVNMFLRDIRKSEPLTPSQEHELWLSMRQGSDKARSELIYANMRYVVTIAKKYLYSGAALEDLLMAGSYGITRAADLFDASLGYRFISFAKWYIECEVRKEAYGHINHHHSTESLDEPIYDDENDADTKISYLRASSETATDWHIRYDNMLDTLKENMDRRYCQGTGEMLEDYLVMLGKGYTTSDFAQKYRLSEQQMKRFLATVNNEGCQLLRAA